MNWFICSFVLLTYVSQLSVVVTEASKLNILEIEEVCRSNECEWYGESMYSGEMASDIQLLKFVYLDKTSKIDLRKTEVTQLELGLSDLSCDEVKSAVIINHRVQIFLDKFTCLVPGSATSQPDKQQSSTKDAGSTPTSSTTDLRNHGNQLVPGPITSQHTKQQTSTKDAESSSTLSTADLSNHENQLSPAQYQCLLVFAG